MKKFLGLVALATGLVFGLSANGIAASGSLKLGWVDINMAAQQSQWGKRLLEDMKRERDRLNSEFEQKSKDYTAAKEDFEKQRAVMDEKNRARKQKELQDKGTEIQKFMADAQQKENQMRAPLTQKISEVMNKIAREDKYDYIFEKSTLLFGTDKEDLTKRVITELDKSSPK